MIHLWPFPLITLYRKSAGLTALFIEFAADTDLKVDARDEHWVTVIGRRGALRLWNANKYYAWASKGVFTPAGGGPQVSWDNEMASRWAVRQMARAVDARSFVAFDDALRDVAATTGQPS
jgi:predicted dehydrogenase